MTNTHARTSVPALRTVALACFPLAALLGCSASQSAGGNLGAGGNSSTSGAGSQSNGSSSSGQGGDGEGGFTLAGSGGSGSGTGGMDMGCATSSAEATLIPLNMFIAVDKSGSMIDNNKWTNVQNAFTQFFADPAAADLRVALRFWPDDPSPMNPAAVLCNADVDFNCGAGVVAACQIPEVDIGPLSDVAHQQALIAAFNAHMPNGGTPTSAALSGATKWCANYVVQKKKAEKAVVLLVTDGDPTSCDIDPNHIAKIADIAYQGAGVLTFAVGLAGSNQPVMDTIAQGGHTTKAFMIGNGNAAADLLAALKLIQGSSVSCSFKMPTAPPGQTLDPTKVNVVYTPSGGTPIELGQVPGMVSCGPKGGWYYDNAQNPMSINLCPTTCTTVQSNNGAKIKVVLGCATHIG